MNVSLTVRLRFLVVALLVSPAGGYAQKPELLVQIAQPGTSQTEFSADGKVLAVADKTGIKLWDVVTGQELRALDSNADLWTLTGDGRIVGSNYETGKVLSWKLSDGSKSVIGNAPPNINERSISDDGTIGAGCAGDNDEFVRVFNLKSGAVLRTLKTHCTDVQLSSDNRTLLTTDDPGDLDPGAVKKEGTTVTVWDLPTGKQLLTRKDVVSYAFSLDGTTLAIANAGQTIVTVLNAHTGAKIATFRDDKSFSDFSLNANGKVLAAKVPNGVRIWDVASGAVKAEFKTLSGTLVLTRDGNTLAVTDSGSAYSGLGGEFALFDVATGRQLSGFKASAEPPICLAFSGDGRMLASGTNGHTIKLWNLTSGEVLRTLVHDSNAVNSVTFSEDSKMLVSGGSDLKLWTLGKPKVLRLHGFSDIISVLGLNHEGNLLASKGADGNNIDLFETAKGDKVATLTGHTSVVNSLAFTPNDQELVSGSSDDTIRIWNPADGSQKRLFRATLGGVYSVAISPNGKALAAGGVSNRAKLWSLDSGVLWRTLVTSSDAVYAVRFNPDGKTLATLGNGVVELWNTTTGLRVGSFTGYTRQIAYSPDGKILATADMDGSIKLRDSSSGDELASLIAVSDREWLVITPEGFFDGSPSAWNKISWRFSPQLYDVAPVEMFFNEFYYPDLLADVVAGKRPHATKSISQKDRRQPRLNLSLANGPAAGTELNTRLAKIRVEISDAGAGANDVRLFRNGSLVKLWHGDVLKGQNSVSFETTIPIVAGSNHLTAYAFNHDNIKSSDSTLEITGGANLKRKGVAYLLAAGVNRYANSQYNLKYAVADAEDFATEFKRQQTALGNYERVEVISLNDDQATKENFLKFLADLAGKSQPEDAVIIYFAGHGTAQQNQFFLIPHDLGYNGDRTQLDGQSLQGILAHSISDIELQKALESVDAGQLLLVIDACNSGQALEAEEKRRGPMNSRGLAQLAYEKGMYILTAAQSYQAAQETARLGHGFLTYSLVEEGLKTKIADRAPTDGQVMLREWLDFATERVPAMQREEFEQRRQLQQVIKSGATGTEVRGAEVQRPRVFYRREAESSPLVVAKP